MGCKRTEGVTAAMNKRVGKLIKCSARKAETLKNMERDLFINSAAMRGTPAELAFGAGIASRISAEMDKEDEQARKRPEKGR